MKRNLLYVLLASSFCLSIRPAHAGPFNFFQRNKSDQQVVSTKTGVSKEKLRTIFDDSFRQVQCTVATNTYKETKQAYNEKKAVCDEMDTAKADRDKYMAIYQALLGMNSSAPGGYAGACSDYIDSKREEFWQKREQASATFWAKWEECIFGDGPSLTALEMALDEAEKNVCTACNNQWPDSLKSEGSGIGALIEYHCYE